MNLTKLLTVALLFLAISTTSMADNLRVMSFNTMCSFSFCDETHDHGKFEDRLVSIADTVRRQDPDLVSFQEFSFARHVNTVSKLLDDQYVPIFGKSFYPTTDATLFVRKSRFEILETGGAWFGPKAPKFNLGWKWGEPRRLQWARLRDLENGGKEFIFVGSHFDNSGANKGPTAKYVQEFFKQQKVPVIFAGDTNIQPSIYSGNPRKLIENPDYVALVGQNMINTFDQSTEVKITGDSSNSQTEICHDQKGSDGWPACRIDHVLISKNSGWKVKSWGEDLTRYFGGNFVSDHRAVIVDLEDKSASQPPVAPATQVELEH